jgi:hypothetical protein
MGDINLGHHLDTRIVESMAKELLNYYVLCGSLRPGDRRR